MDIIESERRAAARHLRDLRRAGRHGRADVRRDRPHLHPRAAGDARDAVLRDLEATIDDAPGRARHAAGRRARGRQALRRRRRRHSARSAAASCWTRTSSARPAACSPRAARRMRDVRRGRRVAGHRPARLRHRHAEPPRMVVFGAIDFSVRAGPAGQGPRLPVTIADPRSAFLASRRFTRTPTRSRSAGPSRCSRAWSSARATRCSSSRTTPSSTCPAVQAAAFATGAGYIGALGSRKTTADRDRAPARRGRHATSEIARVFAPCGLDIGASTVEETAVVGARRDRRAPGRAPRHPAAGGRGADPPRRHRPSARAGLTSSSSGPASPASPPPTS